MHIRLFQLTVTRFDRHTWTLHDWTVTVEPFQRFDRHTWTLHNLAGTLGRYNDLTVTVGPLQNFDRPTDDDVPARIEWDPCPPQRKTLGASYPWGQRSARSADERDKTAPEYGFSFTAAVLPLTAWVWTTNRQKWVSASSSRKATRKASTRHHHTLEEENNEHEKEAGKGKNEIIRK